MDRLIFPTSEELLVVASSEIKHPKFSASPYALNDGKQFICHTAKNDPAPEVVFRFSEELKGCCIFLYNRIGTEKIAGCLRGVQFATSIDGISWTKLAVYLSWEQIYERHGIAIALPKEALYLKLFRDACGEPIHLSQITIGRSLEEKYSNDERLTREFANLYSLPLDDNGHILEHDKPQFQQRYYATIRTPFSRSIDNSPNVSAISLRRLGRFSNALIQVVNAFCIARFLGVHKIYIPEDSNVLPFVPDYDVFDFHYSNIQVVRGPIPSDVSVLEGSFFYSPRFPALFIDRPGSFDVVQMFKHALQFDYEESGMFSDDDIVIHIRSGDIFTDNPHSGYGQPPLAYYRKIIEFERPKSVCLVYQDEANPVINELKLYLSDRNISFRLQSGTLRDDITLLLQARKLVAGRGTFLPGVIALSENIKTVFWFNKKSTVFSRPISREVVVKDTDGLYTSAVLNRNWKNSKDQRQLMITYPEEALSICLA